MAEFLVVRIGETESAPAEWIAVDSNGTRLGAPASGELSGAVPEAVDRKVIMLVPATEVLTTTIDLPIKSAARIQSAERTTVDMRISSTAPGAAPQPVPVFMMKKLVVAMGGGADRAVLTATPLR